MMIRAIIPTDFVEVDRCVLAAFENDGEVVLVRQLRADNDVLIELVAEEAGAIVGHVVASNLTLDPDLGLRCGGLAPLSVSPAHQSSGIGSKLTEAIIEKSRSIGLNALFLLGDPAYYQRFGFQVTDIESDYPAEYFQAHELTPECLIGAKARAHYARAFSSI